MISMMLRLVFPPRRGVTNWAIEGDENTKFFHSIVNKKIKDHNINGINYNDVWIEEPKEIQEAAHIHFSSRFKELNSNRPLFRSNLFMRLDDSYVSFLESEFTLEEVKEAVSDCSSSKSLGPDVLNFKFIKKGRNASFIVLILKHLDPVDLRDYRPISLIGCMYKVLSKLLSRKLCKVIHKLIRPNQMAFLSGRQILDGNLIANDIVNYAKKKKLKLLLFKVDFEKAFDSVNWKFLIDIMSQIGFGAKWCKWIHACLSSASISILINFSPSKEFSMKHGLRQGDPLSPFLFLIIAEALQLYGIGVPLADVKSIARSINCSYSSLPFTYLGLLVGKDTRKNKAWDEVVNHFSNRLSMCKSKLLSVGDRLTLIKAVLGMMLDKEDGDLGIGSLKAKNIGLLAKWKWRFFNDTDALWCKVITKIHGSKGGFDVSDMSSAKSGVWVSLIKCCSNMNHLGIDLNEIMVRKICKGRNTFFWLDNCIKGCGPLKERFTCLSALEQHKSCSVAERWDFSNGSWAANWAWCRQPTCHTPPRRNRKA
ncbi:putative RNA-directed DNA polymerase, eukaryota, reverse transcriptase zinc-binding domain protein [Tanacetum coccineum]